MQFNNFWGNDSVLLNKMHSVKGQKVTLEMHLFRENKTKCKADGEVVCYAYSFYFKSHIFFFLQACSWVTKQKTLLRNSCYSWYFTMPVAELMFQDKKNPNAKQPERPTFEMNSKYKEYFIIINGWALWKLFGIYSVCLRWFFLFLSP